MSLLEKVRVSPQDTIRQVMLSIDHSGCGVALVLNDDFHLVGTVTDGDIRRAILAGVDLDTNCGKLLEFQKIQVRHDPITALAGTPDTELLQMMSKADVRHIPIMSADGRVVDIVMLRDLVREYELPLRAVVMAGGYGVRLRPLTEDMPKPMLPVGERPLLELIVEQLQQAGIKKLNVATHYKGEMISNHFKDGKDFGVDIRYVQEDQPLGTAGALRLLGESNEPLLVMNGDILTRVDFAAMLHFHGEHNADLTVAVRQYEFQVPYGVIETRGADVTRISEKPTVRHFINAGIYLLNPSVCSLIPEGQAFDIPELINTLIDNGKSVVSFPIREYWLDIGEAAQYSQAQVDVANGLV
jgi:dTDP-glucose pyrophosphorylase/CBS domain-containing protein